MSVWDVDKMLKMNIRVWLRSKTLPAFWDFQLSVFFPIKPCMVFYSVPWAKSAVEKINEMLLSPCHQVSSQQKASQHTVIYWTSVHD